jgi:DNA-binding transcriptional regulator LsrR (DeoR family)
MTNGHVINDFLLTERMTRQDLSRLTGIHRNTLRNYILELNVRGIPDINKNRLNEIFKSYNYGKRIK